VKADQSRWQRGVTKGAGFGFLLLLLPVLLVLSPLAFLWTLWADYRAASLRRSFYTRHGPSKVGILVFSDSPNWRQYIEANWLPHFGGDLVLLNWSDRARWASATPVEAKLVRHHIGTTRNFNPSALIFLPQPVGSTFRVWVATLLRRDQTGLVLPSSRGVGIVRFFEAFGDFKHGKPHTLRAAEAELVSLLEQGHGQGTVAIPTTASSSSGEPA
jgi:hypothetical protein